MVEASTGGMAVSPATSAVADAGEGTDADGRPAVELPLHITEKILCSLSPLVSARHAIVCKAWASTVAALLARPPPHLYLCTPPHASSRRGLVVSVPLDAHQPPSAVLPARVRSSDTNGMRCIGATPGGLVAFAAGWWSADVVLANPVTGALTRVAVGEPRMDPRYSRVLVAGGGAGADDDAFFAVEGYKLVLWRHQGREAWSRRAVTATLDPTNNIVSAVDCGGRVYLLHEDGSLSNIDTTAPPPLRMEKLPVASLADQFGPGRLVESDGEVLFVRQLLAYKEDVSIASCTSLAVAGFEVHRLDVKAQRWVKMDVLGGDRALFVSPGSSFSVRASEVEGCRSDCIYFAGENQYYSSPACREAGETSWGVYSMEDRRVLFEHVVVTEQGTGPAEVLWFSPRGDCSTYYRSRFWWVADGATSRQLKQRRSACTECTSNSKVSILGSSSSIRSRLASRTADARRLVQTGTKIQYSTV